MHPAPSIIAFTTLSGLGFGLMLYLGFAPPDMGGWVMAVFAFIAIGLAVAGLMSSTLHLGHPERAVKAFSQWRSSWLSREGVLAIATLVVFGIYAAGIVLLGITVAPLGWLAGLLALATVFATSMIYAQLKSVPRWNNAFTPVVFLMAALAGGALLAGKIDLSAWLLAGLGMAQIGAWMQGDGALGKSGSTMQTATGLGFLGKVRLLEPPHTGSNYLLTEMAFRVGRKHRAKLRMIGLGLAVVVPLLLAVATEPHHILGAVLVLSHVAGMLVLRWLFFAEAEHVMGLYYGVE